MLLVKDEYYGTLINITLESTFSEYVIAKVNVSTEKL